MDDTLKGLQPEPLWGLFDELRRVPRASKVEERAAAWVKRVADEAGARWASDDAGNVVVYVPASDGAEGAPTLILQGHLDMVCEKDSDVEFNFDTDPIRLRREGKMLYAQGTTLGADNGIGVAAGLAVLRDPTVLHGPLELLFTIDEETGLTGAQRLDASLLSGRTLVNLDSEEHGEICIGCAGGADTRASLATEPRPLEDPDGYTCMQVAVRGLKGGHSGLDIALGRANAILLLADVLLQAVRRGIDVQPVSFVGGNKRNAIPREAQAVLWTDAPARLRELVARESAAAAARYAGAEEGLRIEIEGATAEPVAWSPLRRDALLMALSGVPNAVIRMSREVPGLVETSNNVGVASYADGTLELVCATRSSVNDELRRAQDSIVAMLRHAGFDVAPEEGYPGWAPNPASQILVRVEAVHTAIFGDPPRRAAIHAGLECGLLGAKLPGLDMVSIGPDIFDPHSPTEHVDVESVGAFWRLLSGLLADVARSA